MSSCSACGGSLRLRRSTRFVAVFPPRRALCTLRSVSKSATWPELDLVRGIAGVIMVLNHAAAHWAADSLDSGPVAVAFTIGSYAPVLFFVATGLGYGIQAEHQQGRGGHAFGLARKLAILFVADALLWLSPVTFIGNDFLGFIALTMLVLEPLRRTRNGWWLAVLACVAVLGVRYVVVPQLVTAPPPGGQATLMHWAAGLASPPGWSYPPLPWLAFGFVGFAVGVMAQRYRNAVLARRNTIAVCLAAIAVVIIAFAIIRVSRGSVLNRWGSVNGTFLVSAFGSIAAASALAFVVGRSQRAQRWLGLRGLSSLALVPVHYGVIAVLGGVFGHAVGGPIGFVLLAALAALVSMLVSKRWPMLVDRIEKMPGSFNVLVLLAFACLGLRLALPSATMATVTMVVGQLALCALLVVKRRS